MNNGLAALEKLLEPPKAGTHVLRLYLTGNTPRSTRAIVAIREFCEKHLPGHYELDVVDLYQNPDAAREMQIIAAPTLVKCSPPPLRRLIGDLTRPDRIFLALDLPAEESP